jgi:phosphatidylserine decarboxylase
MKLAPEGAPFAVAGVLVLGLLGVGAVVAGGGGWYFLPIIWLPVALWIPVFFRSPDRRGPRGDILIIAPADGKVVSVAEVDEPEFIGGPAVRVSIFMNVFNVHVNRHPASGSVALRRYHPGRFFNASTDKASYHNEQMTLGIAAARGRILVRQIAGLVARRIVTDPKEGEEVRQGERLGIIRFGSRVDTFFGRNALPRVAVGDRAVAGVTVIAEWAP